MKWSNGHLPTVRPLRKSPRQLQTTLHTIDVLRSIKPTIWCHRVQRNKTHGAVFAKYIHSAYEGLGVSCTAPVLNTCASSPCVTSADVVLWGLACNFAVAQLCATEPLVGLHLGLLEMSLEVFLQGAGTRPEGWVTRQSTAPKLYTSLHSPGNWGEEQPWPASKQVLLQPQPNAQVTMNKAMALLSPGHFGKLAHWKPPAHTPSNLGSDMQGTGTTSQPSGSSGPAPAQPAQYNNHPPGHLQIHPKTT